MRSTFILASLILASPAWSQGLPLPHLDDPQEQAVLDRFVANRAEMEKPDFFEHPEQPATFACDVDEAAKYQMGGTYYNNPVAAKDWANTQREVARMQRAQGLEAPEMPVPVDTNFKFTPLSITCVDGKAEGPYTFIASMDRETTLNSSFAANASSIVNQTYKTNEHLIVRATRYISGGNLKTQSESFTLSQSKMDITSDDEKLNKALKKTANMVNKEAAHPTLFYNSVSENGLLIMIMPTVDYSLRSGLLMPSLKKISTMMTSVMRPIGDDRRETVSYVGTRLQSKSYMKGSRMHGPNVSYSENIYKKLGQSIVGQVGEENSREVVIDGVDMIERTMCFQNGIMVKMTPCPTE